MPKAPKFHGKSKTVYNVYVYPGLENTKQMAFRRKAGINKKNLTPDEIINVVADVFNLTREDILGKSRMHKIIKARTCAQAVIKKVLDYSYAEIGDIFNVYNHTTPMYNIKKSDVWLSVYPGYVRDYEIVLDYCKQLDAEYKEANAQSV